MGGGPHEGRGCPRGARPGIADGALLGAAAELATVLGGRVTALGQPTSPCDLAAAGADAVVVIRGSEVEEDVAVAMAGWLEADPPGIILAPGRAWGREVASRLAVRLGAGLIGDAVGVELDHGRLISWKPAFGGALLAAIRADSAVQMVTVRPGVLPRGGFVRAPPP